MNSKYIESSDHSEAYAPLRPTTTPTMHFLFRLADFINVIHWGQVIARGSPQELRADPWVQRSALAVLE